MPTQPKDHKKKSPTSAKAWKKKTAKNIELEVPSGEVALVRRMPITELLTEGVFPDSMRAIVQEAISSGEKKTPEESVNMDAILNDPNKLTEMFEAFDRILVRVCVEPKVSMPPENEEDRDDEVLYADEVDLEDKMFIFQFVVGGTKDLAEFRSQQGTALGSLESR